MMNRNWLIPCALLLTASVDARAHPQKHGNHHHNPNWQNPNNVPSPVSSSGGGYLPPASDLVQTLTPQQTGGGTTGGGDITFPAGCLQVNGIHIGFSATDPSATLKSSAGGPPCVYGRFADITDLGNVDSGLDQANQADAIYMLSLKTTTYNVDAGSVAQALNTMAAGAKQPVWLRLGHEMNWYATHGGYPNDPSGYTRLWKGIADAVDRTKIKMYWCANPPTNSVSELAQWYPGDQYVDINGIDTYAQNDQSLFTQGLTSDFCDVYGTKPIFVGETAVQPDGGSPAQKLAWAKQAMSASVLSTCKSYKGFAWFEVEKTEDSGIQANFKAAAGGIIKQAISESGGSPAT